MKNKYVIRSRISERQFREILRLFCPDIEACKVAQLTAISRPRTTARRGLSAVLYQPVEMPNLGVPGRRIPAVTVMNGMGEWKPAPVPAAGAGE